MHKKIFLMSCTLFILFGVLSVFAITLTKDATERVVVPIAVNGDVCLWEKDKCIQDFEQIVFGRANVYPKGAIEPVDMTLIVFRNKIYRNTNTAFKYYDENVPDSRLKEEYGGGSLVTETGLEEGNMFEYRITYNEDGSYQDLELKIGNENFELQKINSVAENIEWMPQ